MYGIIETKTSNFIFFSNFIWIQLDSSRDDDYQHLCD